MKKVLVLVAALALIAAPAFAVIKGSKHDLSTGGAATYASGTDEVCVFCHTPHGADVSQANAPLWNRGTVAATGNVYAGFDLEASYAATLAAINNSDAPLCLSCHETTTSAQAALNNPPNGDTLTLGVITLDANAALSTDMSNDHPVAFDYPTTDGEIVAFATVSPLLNNSFYGAGSEMWCSTCHDVHTATAQFLRIDNAGSNLCLTCHTK